MTKQIRIFMPFVLHTANAIARMGGNSLNSLLYALKRRSAVRRKDCDVSKHEVGWKLIKRKYLDYQNLGCSAIGAIFLRIGSRRLVAPQLDRLETIGSELVANRCENCQLYQINQCYQSIDVKDAFNLYEILLRSFFRQHCKQGF